MFIWLVVRQWQKYWLRIYNSSRRGLVKAVVMTNELFPLCDCSHFLRIYSCLRQCVPHA